ncbi:cell division protein ZapA [Ferrimonas pelagia]|uniref:Cell division protein ZapA n=1 Tax=Ferrimonas pelagia TaxID=1177826 RepID=A0ABP9F8K1_9GAMM
MSKDTTDIHVLGKSFTVACPPQQTQQLQRVADELNQRMEQLKSRTGLGNLEQLAVMAALNLTHELMQSQQQQSEDQRQMQQRINLLQNTIEQALSERIQTRPKSVEPSATAPYTGPES